VVWFFFGILPGTVVFAVAWLFAWWVNRKEKGRVKYFLKRMGISSFLPALGDRHDDSQWK